MITFLVVAVSLYILLASSVAQYARSLGRSPLRWFLAALAINPVTAQVLLLSRIKGSRPASPGGAEALVQGSLFGAAPRPVL